MKLKPLLILFIVTLFLSVPSFAQHDKLDDLAGTYKGTWASNKFDVSGALVLIVHVNNGVADVQAVFTGSEYLNGDTLVTAFTPLGSGLWKMEYKGKKSKIRGTGIFQADGRFEGDYKFSKLLWTDTGKWVLLPVK